MKRILVEIGTTVLASLVVAGFLMWLVGVL